MFVNGVGYVCVLLAAVGSANASSLSTGQDSVTTQAASAPEASPADAAFEPIRDLMNNLVDSLTRAGGARPEDFKALRFVRDKAAAFAEQFPDDPRGWAVQLQISKWLKEDEAVDQFYSRLAEVRPDDPSITVSRAEYALNRNRFETAIDALRSRQFDPSTHAKAFTLLSDALIAQHQFEASVEALRAIPQEVLERDPFIKVDVDEKLRQREGYAQEWEREQALRAEESSRDDLPRAVIRTSRGEIVLELFENQAPNTVANFISLAEKNFYDGTRFHRVIPNFMAQGGDPNSKDGAVGVPGTGDPGYTIPDEVDRDDARKHFNDTLAMAKTAAPNSGGCQFYLTVTPTIHLNNVHTVFGRVLEGQDVVRNLQPNDLIESIEITRKREHEYVPTTMPMPGSVPETMPSITPTVTPQIDPAVDSIDPVDTADPALTGDASPSTQPDEPRN